MNRLCVFFLGFFVISACSDSGSAKDTGSSNTDSLVSDALDSDSGSCGPEIYPCGPYGTTEGDVAQNMSFFGYADSKWACKEHKDKQLDTSKLIMLSFQDFHLGDSTCQKSKKDLLWIMVSAGWCDPCIKEVESTNEQYKNNNLSQKVDIVNVVFETDSPVKPADSAFLKQWISERGSLKFPVVMDPSFKMGKFFAKQAVPFNMLIDTKTGTIFYRQTGGTLETVGKKLNEFLEK